MPTTRDGFVNYDTSNPEDVIALVNNGMIWKMGHHAQDLGIMALVSGKAQMNDKVPPQIAAYVKARQ